MDTVLGGGTGLQGITSIAGVGGVFMAVVAEGAMDTAARLSRQRSRLRCRRRRSMVVVVEVG
jgi:hypothetical protein